jgi:hypothetical protein
VTFVRDVDPAVPWEKIRAASNASLTDYGQRLEQRAGPTSVEAEDPETWGTSAEAQADLQAAMDMAGGAPRVRGGPDQ